MLYTNYHTHTYRCKHADGTDEEYVIAAISMGFKEIAFTDHSPWPIHPFESDSIRMSVEQFPEYVKSIRSLQKKYAGKISIKLGLEAEYLEDRMDWMKQLAKEYQLDFLIFGNHFYQYMMPERYFGRYSKKENLLENYLEYSIKGLETGMFKIFAHPDIFMKSYQEWDVESERISRLICKKAKEMNVLLEFNLGGVRAGMFSPSYYPYHAFWEIAKEEGCQAVIGIDAHNPNDFFDKSIFAEARQILDEIGIEVLDEVML